MSVANIFSLTKDTPIKHVGTRRQVTTSTTLWYNTFSTLPLIAGDLLLATVSRPTTGAPTTYDAGWTQLFSTSINTSNDSSTRVYYKISDGTDYRISFSPVTATAGAISNVSVFRGVDNTNPFDVPYVAASEISLSNLTYSKTLDIYPATQGSLIVKYMHTSFAGAPTSIVYSPYADPGSKNIVLSSYSYPTPSIKQTAVLYATTNNASLRSFSALPNYSESVTGSFGQCKYAIALRPA